MNLPMHPLSAAIRGSGGGKGGGAAKPPVEAPDSLRSIAYARILDLVSEGEIYGFADQANPLTCVFFNETVVQNADGSKNFVNFQIDSRTGTQTQDPIEGFGGVESESGIGVRLEYGQPWTRTFTNTNVTSMRVRLSVPSLSKTDTTNGNTNGTTVNYTIELATDGGAFINKLTANFTGKASNKYERSHLLQLPPAATGWTVRVTRNTPESQSQALSNQTYVEAVTEIIDAKLRLPMSAYIGLIIDAEQFNNIPQRAYRLRGRIIRIPSNYNPTTRTYTGIWDGTFATAYSNNPAWVFYDMATHPRYGLGHLVSSDLINKWALYKIATYCDELVADGFGGMEPRFTANVYLQNQQDALKVMQDLASMFRGIMYAAGGAITAVGDMPEDPVYTYTPANVVDGKFTYSGSARKVRHTVALVSWNDMSDFGRAKVEYIDDPEGIARYGIQPTEVIAIGCTSRGQARRMGKYILTTERYETDMLAFAVGLDGTIPAPGKVVLVADPLRAGRRTGGRLRTATLTAITVDQLPIVEIGNEITVALPNGGVNKRTISGIAGNQITVSLAFDFVPVPQSVWLIESATLKAQRFRVLGVTENANGIDHDIVAIQHVEGKFEFVENNLLIEEAPISNVMPRFMASPSNVMMTHRDVADTNSTQKIVTLTWSPILDAKAYNVMYRLSDGSWTDVGNTAASSIDILSLPPGVFEVQVSAISGTGVRSNPTFAGPFDIDPNIKPPGFLLQVNADIAEALSTAQNAQAAADGSIVSFWETSAPVIGAGVGQAKEGDIWFDTDDGNKIYRAVGTAWVSAQDDAIAQAILDASNAQATADGKVTLFVGPTAPTSGMQLNDMWFDTVKKSTFRYNGADWLTPIADVTLDQIGGSGVNLLWDEYSRFNSANLPAFGGRSATTGVPTFDSAKALTASGGGSLSMVINDPAGGGIASWLYVGESGSTFNVPLVGGKKYLFSAYVATNLAVGIKLRLAIKDDFGATRYDDNIPVAGDGAFHRVTGVIDMTAGAGFGGVPLMYFNRQGSSVPYTVWIDRLMIEELVGRDLTPSAFAQGSSAIGVQVAIANAEYAQATADGKITLFKLPAAPTSGMAEGDIWIRTSDNVMHVREGSTWVVRQDSAIGEAINAAAGAQATADGKVATFYSDTAPTAEGVGDLWYNTLEKMLFRWNGSSWGSSIGDRTDAVTSVTVREGGFEQGGRFWSGTAVQGWSTQTLYHHNGERAHRKDGIAGQGLSYSFNVSESGQAAGAAFSVHEGERIRLSCAVRSAGSTPNANINLHARAYDADGALVTTISGAVGTPAVYATGNFKELSAIVTIPAGAMSMSVYLVTGSHTSGSWIIDDVAVERLPKNIEEINFGPNYGFPARLDLASGGGLWRIGLRYPGSGHRIGDQRNLPQSNTTAYGSVRTTTALSATSAGAISVNAHTVRYGGVSIAYSAVANAVTGKAAGSTWVVYCYDDAYAGGVRTWYAGASPEAVMALGDGVVVAGQITIPSSGSSSGGGGGTGDPSDWCVVEDMVLPDGTVARDVEAADKILCWDYDAAYPKGIKATVEYNKLVEAQQCVRIVTTSGAAVAASLSTPMTLRNGDSVTIGNMLGLDALVRDKWGNLEWEQVVTVESLGLRTVAKITVHQLCYFAGENAERTIATHNAMLKP